MKIFCICLMCYNDALLKCSVITITDFKTTQSF